MRVAVHLRRGSEKVLHENNSISLHSNGQQILRNGLTFFTVLLHVAAVAFLVDHRGVRPTTPPATVAVLTGAILAIVFGRWLTGVAALRSRSDVE